MRGIVRPPERPRYASFHSIESFLENLNVARVAELFPGFLNPFFLRSLALDGRICLPEIECRSATGRPEYSRCSEK
jgi:hypothetical protein